MVSGSDLDVHIDILGQQSLLKIYTQITLCYSVTDVALHPEIVKTLTNGLERLSASFPWVAGKVVNEGSADGSTDTFKIKALDETPRLVVKDLRDDPSTPTMDSLRRAKFPFRMLDESIVAPRNTLPGSPEESHLDTDPVLLVQATFITGGILLTFAAHHSTMDMIGQGQVISLFSKACWDEEFTPDELSVGNLDRQTLIPLLDSTYEAGPELAYQIIKPPPATAPDDAPSPPPSSSWRYFTFSLASLTALKSLATNTLPKNDTFISTDDALTAFIWQSITRARLPRLSASTSTTIARAVDVRNFLNVPKTYPGLMQNMTFHPSDFRKLTDAPLGVIASDLRSALTPETSTLAYNTRALATYIDRSPDKSMTSFVATLDLSTDLMLSSWAKLDFYDLDFGLGLGKPESVRRPQFPPVESLLYLMPKALDGEIAVAICLRNDDMERLKVDEEFMKYGTYIE
ncbi:hypothetical protein FQN54_007198 [Arachnomyces sp. PD_36]|nr:hypothetical protein FQN54_007198 [Arachnomyces sp. PD_36]